VDDTLARALVPFGGGIDSIVTVEGVRKVAADVALFVVSRPGDRFRAIEGPAAVSGLPVIRAGRAIDPQLLRSAELGFRNGHVPVTGIISAIAILAAVLDGRDVVVMSNEWSASVPTLEYRGEPVNHQYSKSAAFEAALRDTLAADPSGLPGYFSALRDRTELWVGEKFAALTEYHATFRSCNKAFIIDPERRLDHWCGVCDKCCFIDLILAPFMSAEQLRAVFAADGGGAEPLDNPELGPKFRALLGSGTKPFECVGEVSECRAAAVLAARRPDRAGSALLAELAAEINGRPDAPSPAETEAMQRPVGASFVPAALAAEWS
jgi:UDP-N-acetyl-alpha-D-muramoyl-L-alanyl-L-glutamate epimerase